MTLTMFLHYLVILKLMANVLLHKEVGSPKMIHPRQFMDSTGFFWAVGGISQQSVSHLGVIQAMKLPDRVFPKQPLLVHQEDLGDEEPVKPFSSYLSNDKVQR